ncbi:hypothetical protein KI387_026192, partial [Taxus chinensis]
IKGGRPRLSRRLKRLHSRVRELRQSFQRFVPLNIPKKANYKARSLARQGQHNHRVDRSDHFEAIIAAACNTTASAEAFLFSQIHTGSHRVRHVLSVMKKTMHHAAYGPMADGLAHRIESELNIDPGEYSLSNLLACS